MTFLKNLFLIKNKNNNQKELNQGVFDQYREIAKLVKEARIRENLTIQELSKISKIPEESIYSIENNVEKNRPKYPFLRSILIKLEDCLKLKKNTLLKVAIKERKTFKRENKDFIVSKFDVLNTWQGSVLYFLMLILTIFILKRYFISNVKIIEIQNIDHEVIENNLQ